MRYKINPLSNDELRQLAQERSIVPSMEDAAALNPEQVHQLLEELAISRIELEVQNEHLLETHAHLQWALGHARDLYDFAPVGCISTNNKGIITASNLTGARMLGVERVHLIQQELDAYFCNSQRQGINALIEQAIASGEYQRCWLTMRDESLPCRYVQADLAPLAQEEGCQWVLTDVTERQLLAERLSDDEARWKFAVDTSGDGFWDWNVCRGDVFYSSKLKQLYGYTQDEFGTSLDAWRTLVHPEDQRNFITSAQQCLEDKASDFTCEIRVLCKDGAWKWILCRGAIFTRTPDSKVERIIGTHTDITGVKHTQA